MISAILAECAYTRQRQAFFERLKIPVQIEDIQDDYMPKSDTLPRAYGLQVAQRQWELLKNAFDDPKSQCWGMSTLIYCGRRVLMCAQGVDHDSKIVRLMSGRTHRVLTSVVTELRDRIIHKQIETKVHWKHLSLSECHLYTQSLQKSDLHPHDLAALSGQFPHFIKAVQGCPGNLNGVPAYALKNMLEN